MRFSRIVDHRFPVALSCEAANDASPMPPLNCRLLRLAPASLFLAASLTVSAEPALKPGMIVDPAALVAADWLHGEAPKAFEPGKVYLIECWATWCCGCVAHIPRLNEMHRKFHDKGLRVYGMDVWEDDQEKVAKFVRIKGDGMSYPIAFTGKGSPFDRDWLKAIGQRSIPFTFVVRDGKLALGCSSHALTEPVVAGLLDPATFDKTVDELSRVAVPAERFSNARFDFDQARRTGDLAAMAAAIAECEQAKPGEPAIFRLKLDLACDRKDWQEALTLVREMPHGDARAKLLRGLAIRLVYQPAGSYPADFSLAMAGVIGEAIQSTGFHPEARDHLHLAVIQWRTGARDQARVAADRAVVAAKESGPAESVAAYEKFAASLKSGVLPDMSEFKAWEKGDS